MATEIKAPGAAGINRTFCVDPLVVVHRIIERLIKGIYRDNSFESLIELVNRNFTAGSA